MVSLSREKTVSSRLQPELYLSKQIELKAKNKWFVVFAAILDFVHVSFNPLENAFADFDFFFFLNLDGQKQLYLAYSITLYKFSKSWLKVFWKSCDLLKLTMFAKGIWTTKKIFGALPEGMDELDLEI